MDEHYKMKYLKYKQKYIELQNKIGGIPGVPSKLPHLSKSPQLSKITSRVHTNKSSSSKKKKLKKLFLNKSSTTSSSSKKSSSKKELSAEKKAEIEKLKKLSPEEKKN